VAATIPGKFRGRARRDAAAFYLSQLAKGILSGELGIVSGQHQMVVATSEFLLLDIEVKQRKRGYRVEMTLRWPRRPLIKVAAAGGSANG
jgi:amphi-Trp domain-containing protein